MKEASGVMYAVARLLEKGATRQEKWQRKIVAALRDCDKDARLELLKAVCVGCERHILKPTDEAALVAAEIKGGGRDLFEVLAGPSVLETIRALYRSISDMFLEQRDVRTPLRLRYRVVNVDLGIQAETQLRALLLGRGAFRFVAEFLEFVSETSDRSIKFGLSLLEERAGKLPRSVIGQRRLELFEDEDQVVVLSFLMESLSGSEEDLPSWSTTAGVLERWHRGSKGWLEQLVGVVESSPVAREIIKSVLDCATLLTHRPALHVLVETREDPTLRPEDVPPEMEELIRMFPNLRGWLPSFFRPRVVLEEKVEAVFWRWAERERSELDRRLEEGRRQLRWLEEHRDEVTSKHAAYAGAIRERPRRGLRVGGKDHVDVVVTALRNAGIRSVAFHPEEYSFPDTGVRILVRRETPHLLTFDAEIVDSCLRIDEEAVCYSAHFDDRELVTDLLGFVVVDILYRLVVEEKRLRERRPSQAGGRGELIAPRPIEVAPRFRRLPEGWQPRPRAIERARVAFGVAWIPPGHTFVRRHSYVRARYRGGQLVYDLPTEPVAVYGDDDLLETGEWS